MIRTFNTHVVRKIRELTGKIWDFKALGREHKGKIYKIATPCCWESIPDFSSYRGVGEFTTSFFGGGNIRLNFKGVSHTAEILLDGKEIASHYNAYTEFFVVVKNLSFCEHVLTVRADNRFSKDSALHVPNDYMSYGGINRAVVLEEIPSAYIKSVHATPYREGNFWKLKVKASVENLEEYPVNRSVEVCVLDKSFSESVTLKAGESKEIEGTLSFENVREWSNQDPALYYITVKLFDGGKETDDLIDRFGFREVKVVGDSFFINGRKVRIKGVCRHEDHPQFACALPYSAMAYDLNIIKDLGANSVRTSHYPNDEIFLDMCDELGILVWEENHARGLSLEDMQNPNFERQAEEVIREMITSHYNHPSIYIWGILNECASDSEYGKGCYKAQFELIKSLDISRPTSFASCKFKSDISFGLPDIVSYNIYPLWYHDTPVGEYMDELYYWVQNETGGRGKPYLITEIGAGGIYGYRNNYDSKWTEDYQAETLEKQLSAVLSKSYCQGVYVWQFCDIRISDEWFSHRPRTMNNKGIVDEFRRKKLAYSVVKKLFAKYSDYFD